MTATGSDRAFAIVGAGLAGAKAAETLRSDGFDGRVVLVGDEAENPYERPPLSKYRLRGEAEPDSVFVHQWPLSAPAGWARRWRHRATWRRPGTPAWVGASGPGRPPTLAVASDAGVRQRRQPSGSPGLSLVTAPGHDHIDHAGAEAAVRHLLQALGQDVSDPQLRETPRRVVTSLKEMLTPAPFKLTTLDHPAIAGDSAAWRLNRSLGEL